MSTLAQDEVTDLRNVAVLLKKHGMELSARVCEEAADEIVRLRLVINPPPEPEPSLNAQALLDVRTLVTSGRRAEAVIRIRKETGCRLRTGLDYVNKHFPVTA